MKDINKFCQSCGIPMRKDLSGGGTNIDGTKSQMYCSYCFQNGVFVWDCTVQEMRELCIGKLKELGFPKFLAGLMTSNLPRLKRWK